jgi:hypothetical protein
MTFILSKERDGGVGAAFHRYEEYLRRQCDAFPPGAYSLATAEWYFDPSDHRCPHDAWLDAITLSETATGLRHEVRIVNMRIRLLGAYHDGHIELYYPQVFGYKLEIDSAVNGHRDWLYDEFRLSDKGHVLHEIEWSGFDTSGRWMIEASEVEFVWRPLETSAPAQSDA